MTWWFVTWCFYFSKVSLHSKPSSVCVRRSASCSATPRPRPRAPSRRRRVCPCCECMCTQLKVVFNSLKSSMPVIQLPETNYACLHRRRRQDGQLVDSSPGSCKHAAARHAGGPDAWRARLHDFQALLHALLLHMFCAQNLPACKYCTVCFCRCARSSVLRVPCTTVCLRVRISPGQ